MKLVSAVGGGKLSRELDLEELSKHLEASSVQYDPSSYHGIILRFEEAGPAVMIYRSGSFSISGAKSLESLYDTYEKLVNELDTLLGSLEYEEEFEVRNLVHQATMDDRESINLNALAIGLGLDSVEYEPEQFPGMLYRPNRDNHLFLIFATGKIVSTGFSSPEKAEEEMTEVKDEIEAIFSSTIS